MRRLTDIDWNSWKATDQATLVFVTDHARVLLMHKKRGLGAGKVNAPGGRLEPGETPHDCAIREVQEELRVTPDKLVKHGELSFQFVDGYSIFVHVFRASAFSGVPTETAEARPLWTSVDDIPYASMWQDDSLWMPLLLSSRYFSGRFLFDGELMLDYDLQNVAVPADLIDPHIVP